MALRNSLGKIVFLLVWFEEVLGKGNIEDHGFEPPLTSVGYLNGCYNSGVRYLKLKVSYLGLNAIKVK